MNAQPSDSGKSALDKALISPLKSMVERSVSAAPSFIVGKPNPDHEEISVTGDPPLCQRCARLFEPLVIGEDKTDAIFSGELQVSAKLGCYICRVLYLGQWDSLDGGAGHTPAEASLTSGGHVTEDYGYFIKAVREARIEGCFEILFIAFKTTHECWFKSLFLVPKKEVRLKIAEQLSETTGPEHVARLAITWIKKCQELHPQCYLANLPKWHPERLIYVGQKLQPSKAARIIVSPDIPSDVRYTTLSHCWGSLQIFKLQSSNLNVLKEVITLAQLPKVFQDAIEITRGLGIDYLWIDSLCIIQDSPEDWRSQSALMGNVYRHTFCNIAATGFINGEAGLYIERDTFAIQPQEFDLRIEDPAARLRPSLWRKKYYCMEDFCFSDVTNSPLLQRGWVFQERLLASRILHIGSRQIFWECAELEACEVFPNGIPKLFRSDYKASMAKLDKEVFGKFNEGTNDVCLNDLFNLPKIGQMTSLTRCVTVPLNNQEDGEKLSTSDMWLDIIGTYNSKVLTRYEDKLVAISGIAKEFQTKFGGTYLAGLWKENLLHQLLWIAINWEKGHQNGLLDLDRWVRPQVYQAPSWSWAAINADVAVFVSEVKHLVPLATIEDSDVTIRGDSEFGQVIDGCIRIRGRLKGATFEQSDQQLRKGVPTYECPLILKSGAAYTQVIIKPELYLDVIVSVLHDGSKVYSARNAIGSRDFWLLPILDWGNSRLGLILKSTGIKGQYQRLGVWRLCDYHEGFQSISSHTSLLEPEDFEMSHGKGEYSICII